RQRTQGHYERASWLAFDLNRMPPRQQRQMILALLEAASGDNAALRNILLDPALLGADRGSPIGKLYPDSRCWDALNIAKAVHAFCMAEWACGTRDMILDGRKPAGRIFREDDPRDGGQEKVPPHHSREPRRRPREGQRDAYDWRRIARAMGDSGWRKYNSQEKLDSLT